MSIDYNLFSADIKDREQLDKLYQSFLNMYGLSEDEARSYFSFVDSYEAVDKEDWEALVDEDLVKELGFYPTLILTFYPEEAFEAFKNMLRFIGLILKSTEGDTALCSQFDSFMLIRRQSELRFMNPEKAWNQAAISALKEGMGIAEVV